MKRTVMMALALVCASGCRSDFTGVTDTSTLGATDLVIGLTWIPQAGVELDLGNGHADGYRFGMAETGVADGWLGEDCLDGQDGYALCHQTDAEGLSLRSVHPDVGGGGRISVVESETTFLYEPLSDGVTYILTEVITDRCWVWGHDPAYYTASDCEWVD